MKIKNTIVILICSLLTYTSTNAQIVDITLTNESLAALNVNDTFIVSFDTTPDTDAETILIDGYQLVVSYDPSVYEAIEVTPNGTFEFAGPDNSINNTTGIIKQSAATFNTGISGVFEIANISFKVLSLIGNTEIILTSSGIIDTEITSEGTELYGSSNPLQITLNTPPTISIAAPSDGTTIARATDVSFTATATDTEDDNATLTVEWSSNGGTFDSDGAAVNGYFLDTGSSQVTATVTDSNGAISSETITVNVADPTLSITGPIEGSLLNSQNVVFDLNPTGMDLVEDHFHFYINPADVNNLTPEERINTSGTTNTTSFIYGAADTIQEGLNTVVVFIASGIHFEFPSTKQVITFTVDSTLPEITLLGNNPMELILNSTYIEPGATANDSRDGDLSSALTIDASAVDNTVIGDYEVSYTVTDQAGNMATALRTVQVAPTLSTPTPTALQNTIVITPNPVHHTLHLNIPTPHALTALAIYTIDGRLIERLDTISTLSNNITLNVSDYAAGTYLLIASTRGERKIDQFVIQ